MRALARCPAERYRSVQDLQSEVEAYLAGFATQAEDAGLLRQLGLLVRRHRREFLLLAGAVAVVVASTAVAFVRVKLSESAALTATRQLGLVSRQAAPEFLGSARRLMAARDWPQALAAADLAVRLDPTMAEAWFEQGRLHLGAMSFDEAAPHSIGPLPSSTPANGTAPGAGTT